jgi:hypothetical protein
MKQNQIDVYIHTWTQNASEYDISIIKHFYNSVCISTDISHIPICEYSELPYAWGSAPVYNMFSMYESLYKCNELRKLYEIKNNVHYDGVIRCRFDLQFNEKIYFDTYQMDDINVKYEPHYKYNDVHDQFAFSNKKNMDIYANNFCNILSVYTMLKNNNTINAPENILLSPEIILGNYLHQKVNISRHMFDFSIIRE